ncbi:MAG: DNA recombination protein RmuC [Geobacteraceae bacterium]|nr:DNA recombination protein RmuC [Geobacteraceae bacterium]
MVEILLFIIVFLALLAVILLIILVSRTAKLSFVEMLARLDQLDSNQARIEQAIKAEMAQNREESAANGRLAREELGNSLKGMGDIIAGRMMEIATLQKNQLELFAAQLKNMTAGNEQRLDKLRETLEIRIRSLQEDNNAKLEQMRATVDEKLHDTLEKRLGESFKLVSDRLELVHKGLGEMQNLASGVGDLKKVLTNVKTRGMLGEIQLGSLMEQILTPDQFEANVMTRKGSSAHVEFAVKLPGRDNIDMETVWLPIDAKFPQEDYLRLVEAQEAGNIALIDETSKQLEKTIKEMARLIRDKYLDPPHTTDFGIMFLPTEGLYAEVLRRTGLFETLQREFKVVITGPTTLAALLNSLQMGFRTLGVEKRSSEVWTLLGAVKTEFATFGTILEKTRKKLVEASNTIDTASVRSRAIERKLRGVQEISAPEAAALLGNEAGNGWMDENGEDSGA